MNTVLFDLDGTLLPMEQKAFIGIYFEELGKKFAGLGFEPKKMLEGIWAGMGAMQKNTGEKTNEEVFWDQFARLFGEQVRQYEKDFISFYQNEFHKAKAGTTPNPMAKTIVDLLKSKGYDLVLATNPMFPRVATEGRIGWAGLSWDDFVLVTTYENCHFCKPNLAYYQEVLGKIGRTPEECFFVGNDYVEDLSAAKLGISCYFLTETPEMPADATLEGLAHGKFADLYKVLQSWPDAQK